MGNILYPKGKEHILNGDVDFDTDTIKVGLLKLTHTYSSAHEYYDDVSADIVGTPVALASRTISLGVFDAGNTTLDTVAGDEVGYILLYKDTGTASTSLLIALYDSGANLPITPNGFDLVIKYDSGVDKIFSL